MVKTYDILLDIEKELYSPSSLLFSISINDFNSVQLNFVITQDGTPLELTNKIVELAIKKPSGLTVYQTCEITNVNEGKAKVLLNTQSYVEYGVYTAEVYIRDVNNLAVTSPFWYQSRVTIMDEEIIESKNEWSALQEALFAYDLRPQIVEGFPTITPEYIGQMAFDSLNKITYIASDLTPESWRTFGALEGGSGSNDTILGQGAPALTPVRWGQLFLDQTNRIAYIAVGATVDDWEQITNEEFIKHAVTWGEILEKPTAFTPEIHTHDYIDIQGKPLVFPPEDHGHEIIDVIGLQASLDSKADDIDLATKANIVDVYTKLETYSKPEVDTIVTGITEGGGTVVENNLNSNSISSALSANQGRILNEIKADINHNHDASYSPINHNHDASYSPINHNHDASYSPIDHNHDASYSPIIHTHNWGEITGKPLTFSPDIHNHVIDEITGLQASLDSKADDIDLAGKADINHNHDASYSPINHNHDASYSPINHNHDASYSPINHNHDASYSPIDHNHDLAYLSKTGGEITDKLIVTNKGDGKEQIRFNIDRAWSIKQTGIDATSQLSLIPDTNNKTFNIMSPLGIKTLEVRVSDTVETGYINAPIIQENGVKLVDKFALKSTIWTGTQAEYDAIVTKDATTLYFITGV